MKDNYSVLIVEDEQQVSEHISKIIQRKMDDFQVIGIAENGMDALAIIEEHAPDVVVTDIHMPLMDGVELLSQITARYPDICSIVISGYQDFDSVKGALTNGSLDYILKPLSPAKVGKSFGILREKLEEVYEKRRQQLLVELSQDKQISESEKNKYFAADTYYMAIRRIGPLPSRFFRTFLVSKYERMGKIMVLSGRDDHESIYLISAEEISFRQFRHLLKEQLPPVAEESFSTLVLSEERFRLSQFRETLMKLTNYLDSIITIGYSQEKRYAPDVLPLCSSVQVQEIVGQAKLFLPENRFSEFKNALGKTVRQWGEERRPQLWIENAIRQIFRFVLRESKNPASDVNYNFMLDNVFEGTNSLDELERKILDLFSHTFQMEYGTFEKLDCMVFFSKVTDYLGMHCSTKISMSDLCTVFGISPTYMNMLFKKYANTTFSKYLLDLRMEKAIGLLESNRNLHVKDVASLAGFKDQFYFSRLFHRQFGMSPSEYLRNNWKTGKSRSGKGTDCHNPDAG